MNQVAEARDNATIELVEIDTVENACEHELRSYLAAPPLKIRAENTSGMYNDPLQWWKQNEHLFPNLAQLAKVYLSVQATSAPSERVFSAASRIINAKRVNRNAETAGKLLYVSRNWEWYFISDMSLQEAADDVNPY